MQPFFCTDIPATEIAVANAEAFPQRLIERYLSIQILHFGNEFIQGFIVQAILVMGEALRVKARLNFKEAKTATKRIVNHGKATVCRVHHADNVEVLWY